MSAEYKEPVPEQGRGAPEPDAMPMEMQGSLAEELDAPKKEEAPITEFGFPPALEVLLDLFGVNDLIHSIEQERERRLPGNNYQNPFPDIFLLVASERFEALVAWMILANCFTIGLQATFEEGEGAGMFDVFEHIFVLFFFVEWLLRNLAFGWIWIFELPNFLDTILVFGTGVLLKWLLEPLGHDISQFRMFTVLRALRLVRQVHAVRLKPAFKELWILIRGLLSSFRPLFWVFLIATAILYVFAVLSTTLVGHDKQFEDDDYLQELFGDTLKSFVTMFQLMTLDTYFDLIMRPVMAREPLMGVFFIVFVLLGVFVFMNLVTAVIVDTAFNIAQADKENEGKEKENAKKEDLKRLAEIFLEMDKDGSGDLSKREFDFALQTNKRVKETMNLMELTMDEMQEIWEVLDMEDENNQLTIKEFTNGIRRMKGIAKSKDIIDTNKRLLYVQERCGEVNLQVLAMRDELDVLDEDTQTINEDSSELLGLFQEMVLRLDGYTKDCAKKDKLESDRRRLMALRGLTPEGKQRPSKSGAGSRPRSQQSQLRASPPRASTPVRL
jgi:Na+-transporting methylmalonyl-CoA/oxaloacetate decarboxylase gamma subunit